MRKYGILLLAEIQRRELQPPSQSPEPHPATKNPPKAQGHTQCLRHLCQGGKSEDKEKWPCFAISSGHQAGLISLVCSQPWRKGVLPWERVGGQGPPCPGGRSLGAGPSAWKETVRKEKRKKRRRGKIICEKAERTLHKIKGSRKPWKPVSRWPVPGGLCCDRDNIWHPRWPEFPTKGLVWKLHLSKGWGLGGTQGAYKSYMPVFQGDSAGLHEEVEFLSYVTGHFVLKGWRWEPQVPQMPHMNILDLSVFLCMSRRHCALARRTGGCKVLS